MHRTHVGCGRRTMKEFDGMGPQKAGPFQRVEKPRHASQKCKHFFDGMQPAAPHALRSHACGLRRVFSEAHVPGKNGFYLILPPAGGKTLSRAFPHARDVSLLA